MYEHKAHIKNSILAVLFFGFTFGLYLYFTYGRLDLAFQGGVISGILFGITIYIFIRITLKSPSVQISLGEDEILLKNGGANHFRKFESVGGVLYLTSLNLVFCPHSFNVQNQKLKIPIIEIASAMPYNVGRILPTGIKLVLNSGREEIFIVNNRKSWLSHFREGISKTHH